MCLVLSPMRVSDFDFELPAELIAQAPASERGTSRLLVVDRTHGELTDRHVSDLPELLTPGDLIVINDTRVIPARLLGQRVPTSRTDATRGRAGCLHGWWVSASR